ncbi:hypothetical protein ATZ36_00780 [Candidatus Endomicrobiellum trichonymphae]|uniref:Uncharacterized protein n=1 Tax=Endomicrobium trichonymphae TaxID=1408204 RepID=A0A1E5IJE4_ENDTX|nr:hypothetical protein ATZ36_00780 [Candidatus Endomicrobium trichonymphae]
MAKWMQNVNYVWNLNRENIDVLQVKSMNKNLKTDLWNIFLKIYLNRIFNFDCDLFPDCFTGEAFSSFYNKPLDEVTSDFII